MKWRYKAILLYYHLASLQYKRGNLVANSTYGILLVQVNKWIALLSTVEKVEQNLI